MKSIYILISIQFFIVIDLALGGVGGTGGGNITKSKYQVITVVACDDGESGVGCRTIRFYDRPKSPNAVPECYVNHGEIYLPCPAEYTKTNFIQDIVKTFVKQGYTTKIMVNTL